jgi:hypothetical protein
MAALVRVTGATLVCLSLFGLGSVNALATPSPSPPLEGVLAPPPASDYIEATPGGAGLLEGPFNSRDWSLLAASGTEATRTQQTLDRDGFVAGYGRTWVQRGTRHVLIEGVFAFSGGRGAKSYFSQSQLADKALPSYKGPLTVEGIPTYYGEQLYDAAQGLYTHAFAVVKGNDLFLTAVASLKDDLGNSGATQTKKQYDLAPPFTIPPAQWPSEGTTAANDIGRVAAGVLIGVLVLGVIGVIVGFVIRSRQRPSMLIAGASPAVTVTLSPDGKYWWDGVAWKDTEQEVPPAAQRSGDGQSWWDGRAWRPIR